MPDDQPKLNPLDDRLADFADQTLNQEGNGPQLPLSENAELASLQNVIVQLKQAGLSDPPDPEVSARMRAALQQEWQRSGPKPAPAQPSFFQQVRDYLEPIFAGNHTWQVALAVAAVLLLVLFFLPQGGASLTGAAGTGPVDTVLQPAVLRSVELGLGILCAAVLAWLLLKKKD